MTTTEPQSTRSIGPAAAVRRLALSVAFGLAALIRALVHRREVRELLEMDERSLRDIGLSRADVVGALAGSMAKDPSIVLLVRSVDRRSRHRALADAARRVTEREPARAA